MNAHQTPLPPSRTAWQSLFGNLGRIRSCPSAAQVSPDGHGQDHHHHYHQQQQPHTANGGSVLGGLTQCDHHGPSQYQALILPVALAQALASSATESLLSHPDLVLGVAERNSRENNEGGDHGVGTCPGGRGCDDGSDGTSNDDEYSQLVAEVYCSFLPAPKSDGGSGCRTKGENATDAITTPRRPKQPPVCSPSPFVQVRSDERLRFLRLVTELINRSAEEIVCGMGSSGEHYNHIVRRMTNGLWEVALCEVMQPAVDDIEEEDEDFR